jgi:hypothetical protein
VGGMQDASLLWTDFWSFVAVQAAVFLALARWRGKGVREVAAVLGLSLVAALPFGAVFDLLIGRAGDIFGYYLRPTPLFFIVNGLFSYGLALATATLFPAAIVPLPPRAGRYRRAALLAAGALAAGVAANLLLGATLARMADAGVIVVAVGEVVLALRGRSGPLGALLAGEVMPLARFWAWSAALGLVYELANAYFPVWHWALFATLPRGTTEGFIVAFGYFVLFHPLVLAWQSVRQQHREGGGAGDLVEGE